MKSTKKAKNLTNCATKDEIHELKQRLADAEDLNQSWQQRVRKLVREKEEQAAELEKLRAGSRRTKGREQAEAYTVYRTMYAAYESPDRDQIAVCQDVQSANRLALREYKEIHYSEWETRPIIDLGVTSRALSSIDVREGEARRLTSKSGAHQYKIMECEESAEITVEKCDLKAMESHHAGHSDSNLPWKR